VLLHLLEGALDAGGTRLQAGETLRADGAQGQPIAVVAAGKAVAVLATLSPPGR
jgi:hypothetical protein